MGETLYVLTTDDAEAILGRTLGPGEASSIRKTLEGLSEDAEALIASHNDE